MALHTVKPDKLLEFYFSCQYYLAIKYFLNVFTNKIIPYCSELRSHEAPNRIKQQTLVLAVDFNK